jgi:hypothetical protein
VVFSIAITGFAAHKALAGLDLSNVTLNEVLARALLVAAPAFAIRFSTRNFNAAKHQVTMYRHRQAVLDTVIGMLGRDGVEDSTRQQAIIEAVKQVFDPGETGYLNRRDSVGSSDPVIELPFNMKSS